MICAQVGEEIPEMDTCYIKRNPLQLNKAEAYYPHVYASEYKEIRIFYAIIHICTNGFGILNYWLTSEGVTQWIQKKMQITEVVHEL